MDDLLDLNWSSNTATPPPSSSSSSVKLDTKPKDAFADLLSTPAKPVDVSKLSMLEQQRLKQQQQQQQQPSWASPQRSATPLSQNTMTPSPKSSAAPSPSLSANTNTKSSLDDLLGSFGTPKKQGQQDKNMPLNQLRVQKHTLSTDNQAVGNDWDFDFLSSKSTANNSVNTDPLDPFDMDSLMQNTPAPVTELQQEDDNPLGVLAEPAPTYTSASIDTHIESTSSPIHQMEVNAVSDEQEDDMIAHLMDMGFSMRQSKFALEATGGQNLQEAIDLLVQQSEIQTAQQPPLNHSRQQQQQQQQQQDQRVLSEQQNSDIHAQTEKIVSQAQELGGFLYKNATSYLKAGRQKVTKAVTDWQEQQRAQRLQESSGRPKWMTDQEHEPDMASRTIDRFMDDQESDHEAEEQAKALARQKEEELKRKELKRKQLEAQMKKKAKEEQLVSEETYVSPSRRRPASGRSTPRSIPPSSSPALAEKTVQPTSPASTKTSIPTRPKVTASPAVMAQVNQAREQGNQKFKLGQFGDAEIAYTEAIELLPTGHDHLVLLCNNRAMTRLKTGEYKRCIEDCDKAIEMNRQSEGDESEQEGVVIIWRDQMIKSLYRKAEAYENLENYQQALTVYGQLVKLEGTQNLKVNQGMARCRQALQPREPSKQQQSSTTVQPKQDLMSMFDPSKQAASSTDVVSEEELNKSKAVAAMRAKAAEQEAEEAERLEKTDAVNARLTAWKAGKEQNLRALLATLDTLLWPGAQWKGSQMSELINPKKCKICYMKAIGKVHPDKLPTDVTVEQRMIASGIFAALNEAWDAFKAQNQI
ncbi:hypothetical protein BD560DRAFT_484825 [Blakeslea trispora]|nr:hypothetical protein BD560DRAFT_484825 [Blakeslea trispora]